VEATFGTMPEGAWHRFSGEGWSLRIRSDCSHRVTPTAHGVVIHDRLDAAGLSEPFHLNGAYLLLREERPGVLEITTDRIASLPLYVAHGGGDCCFSSRLVDLGRVGWREPDRLGICQWALLGQPLGEATPLAGVVALPNAAVVELSRNGHRLRRRYWRPRANPATDGRVERYLEEAVEELRAAHHRCAPATTQRLALPVTGGFDSRCNLALWAERLPRSRLFHVEDLGAYELPIAREIAARYHQPLLELSSRTWMRHVTRLDPGLESGEFNAAQWRLAHPVERLAREWGAEATVDGFFQDLLFKATFLREEAPAAIARRQMEAARYGARVLGMAADSPLLRQLAESVAAALAGHGEDGLSASQDYYIENRSRRLVYNIVRLNQNHMAVKTPGLDHALIDFGIALPWNLRRNALLYRHIIQSLDPALAAIRYDKSGLPLSDPRRSSRRRRVRQRLVSNLNHLFPDRRWFRDVETGFGRLFREDAAFRADVGRHVAGSSWARALFGRDIIERLERQRRRGRPVEGVIGMLVTLAALERRCHAPREEGA